jgi:hypothetical protein
MNKEEIRLECLKLSYRRDRTHAQVVEDAKVFEDYILNDPPKKIEEKTPQKKKVGNPDLFQ